MPSVGVREGLKEIPVIDTPRPVVQRQVVWIWVAGIVVVFNIVGFHLLLCMVVVG